MCYLYAMSQPRFYNQHIQQFHPLHIWFDGQVHTLVQGVDFTGDRRSLRAFLYRQAEESNLRLRTRSIGEDSLMIQAYALDGTELGPITPSAGTPAP